MIKPENFLSNINEARKLLTKAKYELEAVYDEEDERLHSGSQLHHDKAQEHLKYAHLIIMTAYLKIENLSQEEISYE